MHPSDMLLRWLMSLCLGGLLLVNRLLGGRAAQLVFYALALTVYITRGRPSTPRVIHVPFYFCLVNVASARGVIEAYRGRTYTTWATPRAASEQSWQKAS
jgi:hypothetical protein